MSKRNTGMFSAERDDQALYIYCIGRRDALGALMSGQDLPAAIEASASLELIATDELAAVASAVPLKDYGEDVIAERLSAPAWTAERALRHERVVEYFARRAGVVPLRFGTIYLTRERTARMLDERHAEIAPIITRLNGREEWGVNVFADRAKIKEAIVSVSPRLRELSAQAETASPGQAYLLRKKIEAMRADESRAAIRRIALEIETEITRATEGSARLRIHKDEAGEHGDVAAKLAFLVARTRFDEFRAAAEEMAQKYAPLGIRLELTGPWPAYNFASNKDE